MKLKIIFAAAFGIAASGLVFADGAKLFQERTCWSCHGKDAKKPLLPEYPKIAGQNVKYIERQMLDIKNGVRTNGNSAAMKGVMGIVSEAEIKEIAAYVASLKP
jgi:cytochrome c